MSLDKHVSNTCRSVYMNIRKIRRIKSYLTTSALRTLVQHTVITRLDYCNVLYNGISAKTRRPLQLAQNSAARFVTGTRRYNHISGVRRYNHISGVIRELHWLPVNKRCQYKLLVLVHNTLYGDMPLYINEMLNWYQPTRPLG